MNENEFKELFDQFLKYDLSHDLVGMYYAIFLILSKIEKTAKELSVTVYRDSDVGNFVKRMPHLPEMDYRKGIRMVTFTALKQSNTDAELFLQNFYVALYSALYIYHLPVDKMNEYLDNSKEMTYDDAKEILLNDGMHPNLLK